MYYAGAEERVQAVTVTVKVGLQITVQNKK